METEQKKLAESISTLTKFVKKLHSKRYLEMIEHPYRTFWFNFLLGIARGIGFAVGTSLIFAFGVWLLSKMTIIPLIGDWISKLLDYLEKVRVR